MATVAFSRSRGSSAKSTKRPRKPGDEGWDQLQDERARKLTAILKGDVVVAYDAATLIVEDRRSRGHQFSVGSHIDDNFQWFGVYIDSRKPLTKELIAALRERAQFFTEMADRVAAAKGGAAL